MLRQFIAVFIVVLVTGCATSSQNLNKLSIGMSKVEVIEILGQPQSTRANREVEYLVYSLSDGVSKPGTTIVPISIDREYFVKFLDGRVESYGRVGDFDSTKAFETKHEVGVTIKEK